MTFYQKNPLLFSVFSSLQITLIMVLLYFQVGAVAFIALALLFLSIGALFFIGRIQTQTQHKAMVSIGFPSYNLIELWYLDGYLKLRGNFTLQIPLLSRRRMDKKYMMPNVCLFVCLHARSVRRHTWVLMRPDLNKMSSQALKAYIKYYRNKR